MGISKGLKPRLTPWPQMAPRRRILLLGWLARIAALYPVFGVGGGGVVSGERIASANSHAARISPGQAGSLMPSSGQFGFVE